jgi:hypothetical protein
MDIEWRRALPTAPSAVIISGDGRSAHRHQRFQFFKMGTTKKLVWLPRDARVGGYRHGMVSRESRWGMKDLALSNTYPFISPALPILSSTSLAFLIAGLSGAVMKRDALDQALLP